MASVNAPAILRSVDFDTMKVPSYSIAKTLTAVSLLQSGVDIDLTVGDYVEVDDFYARQTLRSVLKHTAGLPDYPMITEYGSAVNNRLTAWTVGEMLDRAASLPEGSPGDFAYSNLGYTLLRLVLEQVNDSDYFTALKRHVFEPLQIDGIQKLANLADWQNCEEASASVRKYDPAWVYPGMVLATPEALVKTFEGIFSGKLFDPTILFDTVGVNAPGHSFSEPRYGLGVMTDGKRWVGHGGGGPGFSLFILCEPKGAAAHLAYTTDEFSGDAVLIEECIRELHRSDVDTD